MTHQEFDSLLAAYALDALEPEERGLLQAHLAGGCADCERRLADYRLVSEALLMAAGEREPRPEIKAALMRRLAPASVSAIPWWRRGGERLRPLAAGLAAFAVFLAVWLGRGRHEPLAPPAPAPGSSAPAPRLLLRSGSVLQAGRAVAPGGSLDWDAPLAVAGGNAEIVVEKRAVLLLRSGTRLRLVRDGASVLAQLPQGTLFSAVVPGTPFSVLAGKARVDAHGTLFLVRHLVEDKAYVCICRGGIAVHAPGFERDLKSANDAQETGLNLVMASGGTVAESAKAAFYSDEEEDGLQDTLRDIMGGPAKTQGEAGGKGEDKD